MLCSDEHHIWWWQFCSSGAGVSIWFFLWSTLFYRSLEPTSLLTAVLYFGFIVWASLALFLAAGFIGVMASLWFVKAIFSFAESAKDNPGMKDLSTCFNGSTGHAGYLTVAIASACAESSLDYGLLASEQLFATFAFRIASRLLLYRSRACRVLRRRFTRACIVSGLALLQQFKRQRKL